MSAESRAIARARRFKRRRGLKRQFEQTKRLLDEARRQDEAYRSLFRDPGVQAGLLNAGLHILDAFVPGTRQAFDNAQRKPAPDSRQIDAPNVINVHPNKDGVYE